MLLEEGHDRPRRTRAMTVSPTPWFQECVVVWVIAGAVPAAGAASRRASRRRSSRLDAGSTSIRRRRIPSSSNGNTYFRLWPTRDSVATGARNERIGLSSRFEPPFIRRVFVNFGHSARFRQVASRYRQTAQRCRRSHAPRVRMDCRAGWPRARRSVYRLGFHSRALRNGGCA